MLDLIFWMAIAIVCYTFLGYGMVLYALVKLKKWLSPDEAGQNQDFFPPVSLVIPCFNEADIIPAKAENSLSLDYPADKLEIIFITDGSTDNFREVLDEFPQVKCMHDNRRGGKTAAENRAMAAIKTPFVIFTDANTLLNPEAIGNMVRHFKSEKVGCVSGEKRVLMEASEEASAAGEGMYWKYESFLKRLDSELHSAVGAAGELVAFRSSLYETLPEDTILDDFMQSMLIAAKGYKIVYEPQAYALESASASIKDELKRKIRISAGGWQSMKRLLSKIRPFNQGMLFFQYFSHRVLRWTITPFLLILIFFLNISLWSAGLLYQLLMVAQLLFYFAAALGYLLENKKIKVKILFVPFYFCLMNYAVIAGLFRFLQGSQKSTWEKARRRTSQSRS
ncbi:Glycosyltransferase, catalytic subunit of cellulose synthase and poly-beta-1,6-N-acetylglucosamine synthase [Cyclobacterium lianum]|uniref:Glycosyltransferase, catalytic subunit of cellulose synthase and poly-beta-1,6-N-acetylglucosamine synthase n=1 Tax=Cyclobacterium lianum TaxID=388280 RepID=A0A1M7PFI8_9BACT|nr:glycosyltransferase family 2 protein [Cyclobacterium lianum]SHN15779.1 Glycosyltransferase, catalytic subunit of cellulose synthase and poly-beta-1,6-N-acetylglucosamine synthase [Cyclobacterium lianum]